MEGVWAQGTSPLQDQGGHGGDTRVKNNKMSLHALQDQPQNPGVVRAGRSQGRATQSRGDTETHPGGAGMSPEMDTPRPPWASVPGLCHPQWGRTRHKCFILSLLVLSPGTTGKALAPSCASPWRYLCGLTRSPLSLPSPGSNHPSCR